MPRPDQLVLTRAGHEHRRELPDRLEHAVARSALVLVVLDDKQRSVDQGPDYIEPGCGAH